MSIINIGLVPVKKEDKEVLINFSRGLSQKQESLYQLGEYSIPHVTLLQLKCNDSLKIDDLLNDVFNYENFDCTFIIRTLGFAVDQHEDINYFWLRVFNGFVLESIQAGVYDSLKYYKGCEILSKTGRKYDPHFTLAAWDSNSAIPSFKADKNLIDMQIPMKITIGESGDFYQFKKILHSA